MGRHRHPEDRKRTPIRQTDPILRAIMLALEKRYTQEEVAKLSGVPRAAYIRARSGKGYPASITDTQAWAKVAGLKLTLEVEDEDNQTHHVYGDGEGSR